MAIGGKKIPDQLKVLRGTDQPCRMNPDQPVMDKVEKIPRPPRWFSATVKRVYKDVTTQLAEAGILQVVDLQLIIAYCNQYALHIDIERRLAGDLDDRLQDVETKFGEKKEVAPLQRISNEALKRAHALASEFGLTPVARARISIPGKHTEDPFEEFMKKMQG